MAVSFTFHARDFDNFTANLGAALERYGFGIVADYGLDDAKLMWLLPLQMPSLPCPMKPSVPI